MSISPREGKWSRVQDQSVSSFQLAYDRQQCSGVVPGILWCSEPLGARMVSFYVLDDGESSVLFDAGLPGSVVRAIETGGVRLPIQKVIVSHCDADHLGDVANLRRHQERFEVLCHADDRALIEDHELLVTRRYDHARSAFNFGYTNEVLKALRAMCGDNFVVDRTIAEGDCLHIGSRMWSVLHVPGHSQGHIGLWHKNDGILLIGDAVLGFGPPDRNGQASMPATHVDIAAYLATIERLNELPVRLALTGHWPPLNGEGFRRLLLESRQCVERDLAALREACSGRGLGFQELLAVLNSRFRAWPPSEDQHYSYALSGYLRHLVTQRVLREEGSLYFAHE